MILIYTYYIYYIFLGYCNYIFNSFYLQLDFKQFIFFTEPWGLVWGGGTGFKSLPNIWLT